MKGKECMLSAYAVERIGESEETIVFDFTNVASETGAYPVAEAKLKPEGLVVSVLNGFVAPTEISTCDTLHEAMVSILSTVSVVPLDEIRDVTFEARLAGSAVVMNTAVMEGIDVDESIMAGNAFRSKRDMRDSMETFASLVLEERDSASLALPEFPTLVDYVKLAMAVYDKATRKGLDVEAVLEELAAEGKIDHSIVLVIWRTIEHINRLDRLEMKTSVVV